MQSSQTHSGMVLGNVDFLNGECLHGNTDVLEISVALVSGEKYFFLGMEMLALNSLAMCAGIPRTVKGAIKYCSVLMNP